MMAAKTKPKAEPKASAPKPEAKPKAEAPTLTRAEAQEKAVAAVEASLDADGEKYGADAVKQLRDVFDAGKFHGVMRELYARARFTK